MLPPAPGRRGMLLLLLSVPQREPGTRREGSGSADPISHSSRGGARPALCPPRRGEGRVPQDGQPGAVPALCASLVNLPGAGVEAGQRPLLGVLWLTGLAGEARQIRDFISTQEIGGWLSAVALLFGSGVNHSTVS